MTSHAERELIGLEEALWRRESRFDARFMESCLAENFVEVGRSGRRYTRSDVLATPPQDIPARLPFTDLDIVFLAPDVAMLTYTSELVYRNGSEFAWRVSVWVRGVEGWKLVYHQGTPKSGA